ncbi:hypothetical protein [Methylobacterium aerolatum]|uniref:Chromosome segregation ATPase n=1 Tax=Methylobacterium aerolatum TaxID=418708 RepID=A0ABU0HZJ6_9HYPH|nr:hypothetical protein [Methylobacterium aerolatum]MDQ0447766.1 chromosome segregation ATPase [Methylobacterium aerolatum]GJD34864.1 hypothetical protein FMGBMHLM_1771 [Methylobacterium aerolatum]
MAASAERPELTDEQRRALRILADCFADDGIVDDARNIRDALDRLEIEEIRASDAEADATALRTRLDETERRLRAAEAAAARDGWKRRAESAEGKIDRLIEERNEARSAAQAVLTSLKSQGQASDSSEAAMVALRQRVLDLEHALIDAREAMRDCAQRLARAPDAPSAPEQADIEASPGVAGDENV